MPLKPDIESIHLVLVGSFSPVVFQPAWFGKNGLVRPSEADSAQVQLIHPQLTVISMGGEQGTDFLLQAQEQRLSFSTSRPDLYPALRDLTVGTCRLLAHSPVTALGINTACHFKSPHEEDTWEDVEEEFVPTEPWKALLKNPQVAKVTVRAQRPDDEAGVCVLTLEPSSRRTGGLFISINNHYDLSESRQDGAGAAELLERCFDEAHARSMSWSRHVAEKSWGL